MFKNIKLHIIRGCIPIKFFMYIVFVSLQMSSDARCHWGCYGDYFLIPSQFHCYSVGWCYVFKS